MKNFMKKQKILTEILVHFISMLLNQVEPETLTISVEPERKNLSLIEPGLVKKEKLEKIYGNYISTSMKSNQEIIFDHGCHPVLQGFVNAYKNHRPVTISPDIIWLLIIQGFSQHVSANAEQLRPMFVNFDGQKELVVDRQDLNFFAMQSEDYEKEIFPDFIKQISEYTGKSIVETMTPNFTTTTTVSLAVGQLSIMSAMKNYFKYKVSLGGCGFPYVTIEGSLEDWTKINTKLNELKKYKFEWFTDKITEIVNKIIETKKGNVDQKFWKEMIRFKEPDGSYSPDYIDGWFTKFFPYNFHSEVINGPIYEATPMPSEMLSIPFILKIVPPGMEEKDVEPINCELLAGFVGLTQNKTNSSLKPEIGWLMRKKPEIPEGQAVNYQREQAKLHMLFW